MGVVLIGEITQHMLLRIIKLNRGKQRDNPDRFLKVCRGHSILFDKLEFVCMLQCFHKQVFLISAWNIGKNADYLISMLFIKFRGLPTHCIKMNMVTASADGFFFSFT